MSDDIKLQQLVDWAINCGLATGHADTPVDLLKELKSQIDEMQSKLSRYAACY